MEKAEAKGVANQILEDPMLKGYLKSSIIKAMEKYVFDYDELLKKEKDQAIKKILSEDFDRVLKMAFLLHDENEIVRIYKSEFPSHLIIERKSSVFVPRESKDPDFSVRVLMFVINKDIKEEKKKERTLCFGRYSFQAKRWEKDAPGELKWWADLGIKE